MDSPFHLYTYRAKNRRHARPILIVPGAGFADIFWLRTPDDRAGWAEHLLRAGFDVHILSHPCVSVSADILQGGPGLTTLNTEAYERLFTAPDADQAEWPGAGKHYQWPGDGRRGDPVFDRLYAAQVPFVEDTAAVERGVAAAAAAVLEETGPVTLLTHSRGACLGWILADRCSEWIGEVVAVEPHGPPASDFFCGLGHLDWGLTNTQLRFDPPVESADELAWLQETDGVGWIYDGPERKLSSLAKNPVLVVTGEASFHAAFDYLTVDFLRRMGVEVEHCSLEDWGVTGNGHLMMLEMNNQNIIKLIIDWIATRTVGGT